MLFLYVAQCKVQDSQNIKSLLLPNVKHKKVKILVFNLHSLKQILVLFIAKVVEIFSEP